MGFISCAFRYKIVKIFVTFCFLIMFVIVAGFFYLKLKVCSIDYSARRIETLCNLYQRKKVFGDMCSKLCNDLHLTECRGRRPGHGKHVAVLECEGCLTPGEVSRIILKEGHGLPSEVSLQMSTNYTTAERTAIFKGLIYRKIKTMFDVELSKDLDIVRFILGGDGFDRIKTVNSTHTLKTVLHQTLTHGMGDEFLSMKVLGSNPFLPKLYGVCGPAYFVEFTPSLVTKWYVLEMVPEVLTLNEHIPSWKERARIAIKLMDLILKIEDSLKSPIQLCDVKGENFGINTDGDLSILDSDGIRFDNIIPDTKCSDDNTCRITTCSGVCNKTSNRCLPHMVSTNLQTICSRIFIGRFKNRGLLRDPPRTIQANLSALIEECIHPREKNFKLPVDNFSNRTLLFAFKDLLKRTI